MMTAMPMMNQALIMARQYRSDVRFASQCHPVSMLLTPVVIPVVAVVIGLVFPL